MPNDLLRFQLDNGLAVMMKEIHTAPLVSSWVWYRVGARNEVAGKTGLSHWVEHMQFKGTTQRSAADMDHSISRLGGMWNAFTSADWTTFFSTLPANRLDVALALEADRMSNSLFDPQEVELERTVILSEREGAENDPSFRLNEAVQNLAFAQHPYRNEVIGSTEDLLALSREDLYGHYLNYYQPSNAVLCLAGDLIPEEALKLIEQEFGSIPSLPMHDHIPVPEEELPAATQADVHGPGTSTYIQIAYRSPKANSDDFFAFTILESLLTGPSSLNMFGSGGISHRTSRLYSALVENEIVVSVGGGLNATIDPSTFNLYLTAHPEQSPEKILQHYQTEIDQLLDAPVPQAEIDRAVKQARALFAYGSDNITNQAFWMGYASSFADYDWYSNYVERLTSVSPETVLRVARKYMRAENRVVGVYSPIEALAKND